MTRSDEAEWWFNAVYSAVQEVPHGKVTSYGHIAALLGKRESVLVSFWLLVLSSPEQKSNHVKAERPR